MTGRHVITVERDLLADAQSQAANVRESMTARGTLVVNVMASPGAGKTTLLAATADALRDQVRVAVLVGDIATDRDARRLAAHAPAVQLTTGGACHLDVGLVERGWRALGAPDVDILFVENVGNLVCPASHDLGEHLRVVLLSVAEGDDKPAKYPKAFRTSHALAITKSDLLPHVPFDVARAVAEARRIQPDLAVFEMSALTGAGLSAWCEYLIAEQRRLARGELCGPRR
jgi:hydrogenase nickel incorporation protein HypB